MALAKQIDQFRIVGSGSYDLALQNMEWRWETERFAEQSIALDGTVLNENLIAGKRLYVDINWEQNIEPSTWDNMVNDLYVDFIYSGVGSLDFYPDASATSDSTLLTMTSGSINVSTDIITTATPATHGLSTGQRVQATATNITGLTVNNHYYVKVSSSDEFSLTDVIAGNNVDLSGTTTSRTLTLVENRYVEMVIENLDELESYNNTITSFRPSIRLKSKYRYVRTPSVFASV